jgi:broad specificity phosphatase PhoE
MLQEKHMNKIILLRHGKPDVPKHEKMKSNDIHEWIKSYNESGIEQACQPSLKALEISKECNAVVCSDLPRSIESAKALEIEEIKIIDSLFREMGLPYGKVPFLKLRPENWAVLFRVLWFFGYSANSESIKESKIRAEKAANMLKELATSNKSVLFVGHGFTNRFIAKELLSSGWEGPNSPGKSYWEFGVYQNAT